MIKDDLNILVLTRDIVQLSLLYLSRPAVTLLCCTLSFSPPIH